MWTNNFIVISCTTPEETTAQSLGYGLVERCLAACVQVIPGIRSYYRWNNKIETSQEALLLIKTRKSHFDQVQVWLQEHHPYETPEIVAHALDYISGPYAQWLHIQTELG